MRWKWCAPPVCLLIVLLPWVGLAGCGESDSDSLAGTWVGYQLLMDGNADPDGGTNGIGGAVLVLHADGTGESIDPESPDLPVAFTWSQSGDTFTMSTGSTPDQVTCHRDGDLLTLTQVTGSHTIRTDWHLHRGGGVLIGTWDLTSLVDDNGGTAPEPPGPLTYVFDRTGQVTALISGEPSADAEYSTDGPVLLIGPPADPYETAVFAVVGTTLFLFEYRPGDPDDQLLVWRFTRR